MKLPPLKLSIAARILCTLVVAFASILPALMPSDAFASQITNRSLTLIAGNSTNGGSKPGGVVKHLFTFTLPTSGNVGSVKFSYCTTAANSVAQPSCVMPTGVVTTSSTLNAQPGGLGSGWTLDNSTNGAPFIKNTTPPSITGPQAVTLQLNTVTNPTAANGTTFFVRISSYTGQDGATGLVDSGTVAAATNNPIVITGTMPESLVFCTGETIPLGAGSVPNCAGITNSSVTFNNLFSPTATAIAESQMAASTNAGSGYIITVNGTTLTSGANTITAMTAAAASTKGISQFGLNLKANTSAASADFPGTVSPYISANVSPNFGTGNYTGAPFTGYDTADSFKFQDGDTVARTDNGNHAGSLAASDAQVYTASYIVNVPGSQPAGTYTTTLTYICTPTF